MTQSDNPFDGAEIISSYTDAQALEDGALVDISPLGVRFREPGVFGGAVLSVNRMTRALWADFLPFYPDLSEQTNSEANHMDTLALASALRTKLKAAKNPVDNTGEVGDIYLLPGGNEGKLWLVKNEVGGFTLMNPSDY